MDQPTKRYACYMVTAMVFTLWYALSPSKETRVWVADNRFRTVDEGESRNKYRLSLALEQGKTYRIEESTRHTATTRNARSFAKNAYEVLAQTEYLTSVSIDIQVESVRSDRIECRAILQDFVGYEEINEVRSKELDIATGKGIGGDDDDDEDKDDTERQNRNRQMFQKVREETRGTEFRLVLGPQGTVLEMETSKLREKIVTALHEVGQLPMHLEHALLVGGYDVYPANGASFGPQGRTSVRAPVYRMKNTGCDESHQAFRTGAVKGRILVVNRGDCPFNKKAMIAAKFEAAALVVVDTGSTEEAVMTYMSGEADVPIVSVIVNKEAGEAIENEMQTKADYKVIGNGDLTASDRYLVEILGGVEAVQALQEGFEDDDDVEGDESKPKKRRSHNYNPIHSDGLHDFVGIGYVVDEVIRTRFSIFPTGPVSIGSSWQRTLEMSDGIDPTVRAEVTEKYKLVSVSKAEGKFLPMVKKGDLIAEIQVIAREKPAPPPAKTEADQDVLEPLPINPQPGETGSEDLKITPQFSRPSFRGHEFSTKGTLYVHVPTGFIIGGEATSESTSERTVVVVNKKSKKRKTLKAHIDLLAITDLVGNFF